MSERLTSRFNGQCSRLGESTHQCAKYSKESNPYRDVSESCDRDSVPDARQLSKKWLYPFTHQHQPNEMNGMKTEHGSSGQQQLQQVQHQDNSGQCHSPFQSSVEHSTVHVGVSVEALTRLAVSSSK